MKKLSLIILTYNSQDVIYDSLDSVLIHNDIGDDLEIIVVDNMSKDTDEMFLNITNKYRNDITLIKNSKNGGYGCGNNVGIKKASAPIIMIMNPDVRLIEPIFSKNIASFNNDNTIAMIGLQQMESISKKRYSYGTLKMGFTSVLLLKIFNFLGLFSQKLFCLSGACFMARKSVFIEAGMFDENIFMYGEEKDIHFRISKLNKDFKMKFDSSMRYIHPKEKREVSIEVFEKQFKSYIYTMQKQNKNIKANGYKFLNMLKRKRLLAFLKNNNKQYKLYSQAIKNIKLELCEL